MFVIQPGNKPWPKLVRILGKSLLLWKAGLPFLVSFSWSSRQEMIKWERFRSYWRKLSWFLDLKFSWKMEVFFLPIVKTDATRARMSPSFHRGKMAVKAKKKKEKKCVSWCQHATVFFCVTNKEGHNISSLCWGFIDWDVGLYHAHLCLASAQWNLWVVGGEQSCSLAGSAGSHRGLPASFLWESCSSLILAIAFLILPKRMIAWRDEPLPMETISWWNCKKSSVAERVTLTEWISLLWEQQWRICHLQSFS